MPLLLTSSLTVLLILLAEIAQSTIYQDFPTPPNLPGCLSQIRESGVVPCYCDSICKYYGDCCHEFRKSRPLFTCLKLSLLSVSTRNFAFVFNRCPPGAAEKRKQLCERPVRASDGLDRSIVIASDDKRLFRNVHCALCHQASYKEPKSRLRCTKQLDLDEFRVRNVSDTILLRDLENTSLAAYDCKIETDLSLHVNQYRLCDETKIIATHCPDNWVKNSALLSLGSLPANLTTTDVKKYCADAPTRYIRCEEDDRTFRNPYCLACLKKSCVPYERRQSLLAGRERSFSPRYTYSIITDFTHLSNMDFSVAQNASETKNATQLSENLLRNFLSILTISFCALSAASLVFLIIALAAAPSLRNFGGVLTSALASSLLVGLLCFLVGPNITHFPTACRIVGAVMYFAYLSSFAWMSLFAADVLRTFASSAGAGSAVRGGGIGRRFAKFAVGGWLLPLIVTLAAVTVDAVWPQSAVSPRFGRGQCYFNNGNALLGWFYVPVAVAVAVNVAMSAAVIAVVWRTAQQTKSIRRGQTSGKWMVRLSLKVTSIFGAIWLLGLSAVLVKDEWFTEIAGLVNSLQGVLVSFSVLLNSRTIRETRSLRSSSSTSVKRAPGNEEKKTLKCFLKDG